MKREQGFGLPELMIGFFLSTFILMMVMQHVLQAKQQSQIIFSALDASLELQWVSDFVRSRVRMAGFTPCLRLDHLECFDARVKAESMAPIEVINDPETRLMIHRMRDDKVAVARQISALTWAIDSPVVRIDRPVVIADCYHAEVHDIENMVQSGQDYIITLKEPLMFDYEPPVYLGEWISELFFVRATSTGSRALFYRYHRVDQLSEKIRDFSAKLQNLDGETLLHLVLQREDKRAWILDTRVRAR